MQKLKQAYNIPSLLNQDTTLATSLTSTNLPLTSQITNTNIYKPIAQVTNDEDMMAVVEVDTDITHLNEGTVAVSTTAIQSSTSTDVVSGGGGGRIRKKQRIDTKYDTTSHVPYTTDSTTNNIQCNNIQTYSINEIFLPAGLIHTNEWTPNSSNLQPLIIILPNFGFESKNQTLGQCTYLLCYPIIYTLLYI